MKEEDTVDRRAVMAGVGIAVAGLVASNANAQTASRKAGAKFQPARHEVDAWFDQLPGSHRVFVDTASANGAAEGLGYANNLYIATDSAYSGQQATPAIVVCFRHFSTPFGYNDAIWAKYGQIFNSLIQYPDPMTGNAPTVNLLNSNAHKMLSNRGVTVDALAAKGTHFAICNMATQFIAGAIAQQTGRKMNEVHDELVASAVGNSHFVSAGVMALTRAQEYGYSLLIA
jgi:intracellular sulfur oxidation DsrE/DsrF family protein